MTTEYAKKLLYVIDVSISEDDEIFTIEDENLQVFKKAIVTVLNTMTKYQKIEQILDDCDLEAWEVLEKIRKVVENGNDKT